MGRQARAPAPDARRGRGAVLSPSGIPVHLSRAEIVSAALIGVLRRVNGLFGARQSVPGIDANGHGWISDIEGACAERTFAKALSTYWDSSTGRYRNSTAGDVGEVEVRWTPHDDGHLVLRPDNVKLDSIYVLVVGCAPDYRVVGWLYGREGIVDTFWKDPGKRGQPCWWIPQTALRDLGALP